MLNGDTPRPRTSEEWELERVQKEVTRGQLAEQRRRELIVQLHYDGMSQVEIAERLSRASQAVGGDAVGIDAVQHTFARNRYKLRRVNGSRD